MALDVLHLTDLHLLADAGARLHGWDVARAFDAVLTQALTAYPAADALILGGDLVDDLSVAGYQRLNACLATLDRPILAVAGNHDHPARMAAHLSCCVVHEALTLGAWQLVGIDTHVEAAEHGAVSTSTRAALERQLARCVGPTLLVLHHPPVPVGTPWIDAIGLRRPEALAQVIDRYPQVRGLVAGHVHQSFSGTFAGRPLWTTPATMRQFLPGARDFAEDHQAAPGYRCIRLEDDGHLSSRVDRLEPATYAALVDNPA